MTWRRAFRWFGALILLAIISGPALIAVAGINIDGGLYGDVVLNGIAKPFLFMCADRPMFDMPEGDFQPDARDFLTAMRRMRERTPARPSLLLVRGAAHFNFFDQALLTEPTLWRAFGAIGSGEPVRVLDVTRRYARAFLDTHLKAARDGLLDGTSPDYPEVRFK